MGFCKYYPSKFCSYASCDGLNSQGMVVVCPLKPNKNGRFMERIFWVSPVPVFSKHRRRV